MPPNNRILQPLYIALSSILFTHISFADTTSEKESQDKAESPIDLSAVVVSAPTYIQGDAIGYGNVYEKNMSSVFRGQKEIERSLGQSPADLLKGMTGVFSGDARNSGAIDVNIRGVQGQGRVPVTIDGTEQAISVYRGYFGVSNRNYIDPSLISSITVEKGGALSKDIKTSVGGGVAMKTLGINDVVAMDEKFGIDFKIDTATNTTSPRLPDMSLLGTDYRDDPLHDPGSFSMDHPNLYKNPEHRNSHNNFFNLKDYSGRIAAGYRHEYFDLMAAFSYRKQGNYFAGKNGGDFYSAYNAKNNVYTPPIGEIYKPGSEVLNTSSLNKSFLIKNTWHLPNDQKLLLTARHSHIEHGELMPSRLVRSESAADAGMLQWPMSKIKQKAYSVRYQWNPEDNDLIDADINLWKTTTNSNTYSTGGYIFGRNTQDLMWDWCMRRNGGDESLCQRDNKFHPYVNQGIAHAKNTRWGITASNTFTFSDSLNFTAGIDFQKERLRSNTQTREGRRQEYNLSFNTMWKPVPSVTINAGVRRDSYNSHDDLLAEARRRQDPNYRREGLGYMDIYTERAFTQDEYDFYQSTVSELQDLCLWSSNGSIDYGHPNFLKWRNDNMQNFTKFQNLWMAKIGGGKIEETHEFVQQEGDGKYHREDNPLLNGTLTQGTRVDPWTGEVVNNYEYKINSFKTKDAGTQKYAEVKKRSGHAWSPVLSIGWDITDHSRIYARYAEAKRFPSMFEDTVGFTTNVRDFIHLKPEESRTFEIGYIHDLSWLPNTVSSDIKVSYYDTTLKNVIERDATMYISQVDKQKSKGIEVQARYENERFFANFGMNYNLKNKTCDESSAMMLDPTGGFPTCVDGGFPNGFLRTSTVPKYSMNLTLGGRFLNDDLEVGTSLNYHSKARNSQEQWLVNSGQLSGGNLGDNAPIRWDNVFLVDAFMSYKVDKNFTLTFSGHNLTNEYYIDPLTRSYMPAPGRTFRIGFTGHF